MIYLEISLYLKQQPKKNILIYQHCLFFLSFNIIYKKIILLVDHIF